MKQPVARAKSALMARILERTEAVFNRLDAYSYLSANDRVDFSYYRSSYLRSLLDIDGRLERGEFKPVDLSDFPQVVRFPSYEIHAALFIGSFDPFQMTHLATALRYLASNEATAPIVFIVPEGHDNPRKARKCDYRYRFDLLSEQVADVFEPLIVPLDIGEGADTIEIVRRFIAMFPGARIAMTHLLGSDVLPFAAALLPLDLAAWREEAKISNVDFSYRAFVVTREGAPLALPHVRIIKSLNLPVYVDTQPIGAPSSSDFRDNHAFSIVFPTESVIRHVEVLFRYRLNKPWNVGDQEPAAQG